MELPLVVGVDGSESSLRAVDWAADEAGRHSCALRLVHASLWDRYERTDPGAPGGCDGAERLLVTACGRAHARRPELRISTVVRPEEAPNALLHAARNARALVTGECGRGPVRELLLGSVSLTVAARAACPVIVVRGDPVALAGGHERILLGVGETASGGSALRFAFEEAAARGCVLDAVRAWRSPAYEKAAGEQARPQRQQAERMVALAVHEPSRAHPDVVVRTDVVEGPARRVLIDRSAAADLLVVGARRRHGHISLQLGRVGHAVLHHARCPVAVVPRHGD
ncbi:MULTISPECIES: universal stress protein [unclassified Streptomyces]|uniref:universal stress protein n=1 Tax=unclassified Streptomyces TaxID=2593676 RepID=UPI000DBA08D4|nr:universal stress protein [Streptomyces sp. PsTaAH-137]MYT75137.1 universal stress protein [Streptomyces sp. SID8367]RAJ77093.1 nucleotide-binding universal stress UspA family protein [Streptomyces sp. PsTaAH-137]